MKANIVFSALICLLSLVMGYFGVLWGMQWKNRVDEERKEIATLRAENKELKRRLEEKRDLDPGVEPAPRTRQFETKDLEDLSKTIAKIRGLEFPELTYEIRPRAEVEAKVRARLEPVLSEADLNGRRFAYTAMGFIDREVDLGSLTTQLLASNVNAYYDEVERAVHLAADLDPSDSSHRFSVASAMMGALIDSHFGSEGDPNSDQSEEVKLAMDSLVEGDISLVVAMLVQREMQTGSLDHATNAVNNERDDALTRAPLFLRDLLVFPTLAGGFFCRKLHAETKSFEKINAAYTNPPLNTSEIFHHEKYFARISGKAEPADSVESKDAVVADRQPVWSDVAGELRIRMLFKPTLVPKIASAAGIGWTNDRYWVYELPADEEEWPPAGVVWHSSWDTAQDATEFFSALHSHLRSRYKLPSKPVADGATSVSFEAGARRILINLKDREVVLVDAATADWLGQFRASEFAAKLGGSR